MAEQRNISKVRTNESDKEQTAGALQSSLSVELHSIYAVRLWEGRPRSSSGRGQNKSVKHAIMSMPQAIKKAGVIYFDSLSDNPYADEAMLKIEESLTEAGDRIHSYVTDLEKIIKSVPSTVSFTDVISSSPLNIGVFSRSPLGYRCVWLLVGYDQMALKAFQAAHYGLISRNQRDDYLRHGAHLIRKIYGILRPYSTIAVTRRDLSQQTKAGISAIEQLGHPNPDVLSGKKRSTFSPPLKTGKIREKAKKS